MKYIFADVGAYDGDSIKEFMRGLQQGMESTQFFERRIVLPVPPKQFEIHAFEPNPLFFSALAKLGKQVDNIVEVDTAAAWISDGIQNFAIDKTKTPLGSTLMKSKKYIWDNAEIVEVHTFDFSKWVRQFKDDYLIVKLDIEGAEFPILDKMIRDGTVGCVDKLWVEFHANKIPEYTTSDKLSLIQRLKPLTDFEEWH